MKNFILSFLVSRGGGIITPIIAAIVAAGVARLAAFAPELASTIDQTAVATFVWGLILAGINAWTNSAQTSGVKRIQALVNTDTDGIPGPVTYTEVRRAVLANATDRASNS